MPMIKPLSGYTPYYNTIRDRSGELGFTSRQGGINFSNNYTLVLDAEFNELNDEYIALGFYSEL